MVAPQFPLSLFTRIFFLLFLRPVFGVLVGPAGISSFTSITKLCFTFSRPKHYALVAQLTQSAAWFAATHIPGTNNGIADALTFDFNFQAFHSQVPHAKTLPVLIPPQLLAQHSIVIQKLAAFSSTMYQGLAASTRRTYSCVQEKFANFCVMTGHLSPYGSLCPASECGPSAFLQRTLLF